MGSWALKKKSTSTDIWVAIGLKVDGHLIIYGRESTSGVFFNLDDPNLTYAFAIKNSRWGIGLGGQASLVVCLIFNTYSPYIFDGETVSNWGITVAASGKWSELFKMLREANFFETIEHIGPRLKHLTPGNIEKLRKGIGHIQDAAKVASGYPGLIVIDTPIGWGAEVSATYTSGTIDFFD